MLKLEDIVALAKQGYKPADVKELIELSKSAETSDSSGSEEDLKETKEELQKPEEDLKKPEANEKPIQGTIAAEASNDKVVDYKKKVEELEAKISELQKANTTKNIADTDTKSDSDVVADLMKSFM